MYARTITADARLDNIEAGIAHIRDEVYPTVTGLPGCVGMSLVVDRESGRCIVTSAWDSEESMKASNAPLAAVRQRASEVLGAPLEIAEWELAVMHRDHHAPEGACVRSTWVQGNPADADRNTDVFKMTTLPAIEDFDGFCSASLLINRSDGRGISTVTYDSRAALERTRPAADAVRAASTSEMGMGITDVREFDLVLAHLHAPELV